MYSRIILLICLLSIFTNCNQNHQIEKIINVDTQSNEMCKYFIGIKSDTLKFNRYINIVENSLNDTIILGHRVLAPGQLGSFKYTKFKNRNDISLNLEYDNSLTDRICFSPYKGKRSQGILKLKIIPASK